MNDDYCSICGSKLKRNEFEICQDCANKFGIDTDEPDQKIIKRKKNIKKYKGSIQIKE